MDTITTPAAVQSPPETSIQHSAQVSLTSRSPASVVHLVQYDTTVPIIAVALTANGQPYTVPSGAAVNVRLAKPDGTYVYDPAYGLSADSQTVYIAVTVQMTVCSGRLAPVVEVVIDGGVAATGFFILDIDPNPIPDDVIASTDEYKTIQQLAAEVTAAAQVVENNQAAIQAVAENIEVIQQAPAAATNAAASATLAESWAVGGTGTRPGENTNNAQYWAEQAQTISGGNLGWYETEQALQAAHPTGQNGQWAIIGSTDTIWTWDSDTGAWVDSGNQVDLSNYYTIPQVNARFEMPVGYIFNWLPVGGQSVDLTTPQKVAAYFGYGTWQNIAQGQFLLGQSSSHPAETTGGEETHTLTEAELPEITGSFDVKNGGNAWGLLGTGSGVFKESDPIAVSTNGDKSPDKPRHSRMTMSFGGGSSHNNMPPYLTVYMWQRIA